MDNKINNNPMEVSIMSERKYPVITISREFGAGGHSIARVVSERLGIPYYDRDFAKQAAARSGYSQEDIDREGENLSGSLTVGYQKKVPAGRIKPAFFVSNFWFLSIVFYCNVL